MAAHIKGMDMIDRYNAAIDGYNADDDVLDLNTIRFFEMTEGVRVRTLTKKQLDLILQRSPDEQWKNYIRKFIYPLARAINDRKD